MTSSTDLVDQLVAQLRNCEERKLISNDFAPEPLWTEVKSRYVIDLVLDRLNSWSELSILSRYGLNKESNSR